MASQHERASELRRFLVINFWIGTRESGYLIGPALVSTPDYKRFYYWNEPSAVVLKEDDYEVVKIYRLGITYAEVIQQFANDFPLATTCRYRSAGWIASDGTFFSAEGWADFGQHPTIAA